MVIDEDEPYTFYLCTGVDDNEGHQYTRRIVTVGKPDELVGPE